ncbi:conserved exported hypothetical protein [Candidatus Terasakiella magnetica]|uniref:Lipoprotein n=2 Tax=Candidatus Terasakiella magnetica TaxID=1867952 RepID=A0A1C3RMA7_9PROT|nr:conserved exported hypothetical protein [Candidatus Terasakiella magnetica]
MKRSIFSLMIYSCLLCSCVTPQYRDASTHKGEVKALDINYKVSGLFHRDPVDCVSVMKSKSVGDPKLGQMISIAFARHLGEKVDRVIFPRKRERMVKKQGYDLTHKGDRRRYSLYSKCRFYGVAELYDLGDDYVGFAAKKHVGVRLDIRRFEDDEPLWQAAHTVWRADGAMPLSPFSVIGGMTSATLFKNDREILPSLVDDAMRRMVKTLPYSL